jgi:membrane associated rhomboid family serine protease
MSQMQFQAPTLSPINKKLLISLVTVFLLTTIMKQTGGVSLEMILGLSTAGILKGKIWGIFTYAFIETSMMGILFNGLLIWFVGSDLELRWGKATYLKFLFFSIVGPAVVYFLIGLFLGKTNPAYYTPLMGINGFSYALLVSYAVIFPDRQFTFMFLFPMKAKYFCMLLGGIELYMGLFSSNPTASLAHLAAMGTGFGFLKFRSLRAVADNFKKKNRTKNSNLYIVKEDEDDNEPKYWQ